MRENYDRLLVLVTDRIGWPAVTYRLSARRHARHHADTAADGHALTYSTDERTTCYANSHTYAPAADRATCHADGHALTHPTDREKGRRRRLARASGPGCRPFDRLRTRQHLDLSRDGAAS